MDLSPGIRSKLANQLTLQHYPVAVLLKYWREELEELPDEYNSDEDWKEKRGPVDPERFYRALKRRSDELDALE